MMKNQYTEYILRIVTNTEKVSIISSIEIVHYICVIHYLSNNRKLISNFKKTTTRKSLIELLIGM